MIKNNKNPLFVIFLENCIHLEFRHFYLMCELHELSELFMKRFYSNVLGSSSSHV